MFADLASILECISIEISIKNTNTKDNPLCNQKWAEDHNGIEKFVVLDFEGKAYHERLEEDDNYL